VWGVLFASGAFAWDRPHGDVAFMGGYQVGGSYFNTSEDIWRSIASAPYWSVALDVALDPSYRQGATANNFAGFSFSQMLTRVQTAQGDDVEGAIYYGHFTSSRRWSLGEGSSYLSLGVGATLIAVDEQPHDSMQLSMSLTSGYLWQISRLFGIRFEARGVGTFFNPQVQVKCGQGCAFRAKAKNWGQGALAVGFSLKF
jgi:hypothetical protein